MALTPVSGSGAARFGNPSLQKQTVTCLATGAPPLLRHPQCPAAQLIMNKAVEVRGCRGEGCYILAR